MDKTILVIDDNDQKNLFDRISRRAKEQGINLLYKQFNVGSPKEPGLLTDGKIDVAKVKAAYKTRFKDMGLVFNMIVCDWDLSDEAIDGAELLRRLGNECFKINTPRILYSSLLREKIEEQLNKYDKDDDTTKDPVIKYLVSLIRADYLDFVVRDDLEKIVLAHLKDSENIDFLLEEALMKYPDSIMMVGHKHGLEGKTFLEVARQIRDDAEVAYNFKRNLVQEVIDYMTQVQSKKCKND